MACTEKSGGRFTNMRRLATRQHKSVGGHKGFVQPRRVVVQHAGQPSVNTAGPTLAQTSAMGATTTQINKGN
jgi:hypothetical protein